MCIEFKGEDMTRPSQWPASGAKRPGIQMIRWALFLGFLGGWLLTPQVIAAQTTTPQPAAATQPATNQLATNQPATWSTPIILGDDWFPDVAADPYGQVHVAWAASDEPYDMVMYRSSADGVEWTEANDIMAFQRPLERYAARPALLVDTHGDAPYLFMGFRDVTLWVARAPLGAASSAQAWSEPIEVASGGYFSELAQTSDGRVHLLFTENFPDGECLNCFHLMSQYTDDGITWSSPLDLSIVRGGTAKPQIIVDQSDQLHVVFEAGYGGDLGQLSDPATVMYARSDSNGEQWSSPVRLDPTRGDRVDAQARNVAIAMDTQGALMVVWWGIPDDRVYFQRSTDQGLTWSSPVPIANVWGIWSLYNSRLDTYAMVTDSAGTVHLLMMGRRSPDSTTVNVMALTWDGAAWSAPTIVASYDGDIPEWPRLAVGNGNQLHAVWFVRNAEAIWESEGATAFKIWYAKGITSAPAIAPLAPVTPTIVTNVVSNLSPTLETSDVVTTPRGAAFANAPIQADALDTLKTENDDLAMLALSLAPVLLVVAATALAMRYMQRG